VSLHATGAFGARRELYPGLRGWGACPSCAPNAALSIFDGGAATLYTLAAVQPGEEVRVSSSSQPLRLDVAMYG
jgi:hypothetical protein